MPTLPAPSDLTTVATGDLISLRDALCREFHRRGAAEHETHLVFCRLSDRETHPIVVTRGSMDEQLAAAERRLRAIEGCHDREFYADYIVSGESLRVTACIP